MKNYFWVVFSIVWAGLIVYLSFFSPTGVDSKPWFENQDKFGHFLFYAVQSMALIKTFSQEIVIQKSIRRGALGAFFFGALIEFSQYFFTTDRDGNFMDALANGLGILLMVILIKAYPKFFYFDPMT
tara:strand:+ start:640 stop:1020 length:381 start_codon:yes stop_codon:yes gene_type:complete